MQQRQTAELAVDADAEDRLPAGQTAQSRVDLEKRTALLQSMFIDPWIDFWKETEACFRTAIAQQSAKSAPPRESSQPHEAAAVDEGDHKKSSAPDVVEKLFQDLDTSYRSTLSKVASRKVDFLAPSSEPLNGAEGSAASDTAASQAETIRKLEDKVTNLTSHLRKYERKWKALQEKAASRSRSAAVVTSPISQSSPLPTPNSSFSHPPPLTQARGYPSASDTSN
ncbi:hypothetical protein DIPPA_17573 [Diplonema papillatum]|nr:hypothetical protein DIPPA_17573 [Diplonema papillatum]